MCEHHTIHLVLSDTPDEKGSWSLYSQQVCVSDVLLVAEDGSTTEARTLSPIAGTRKFIAQFITKERAMAAGKHIHSGGGLAR